MNSLNPYHSAPLLQLVPSGLTQTTMYNLQCVHAPCRAICAQRVIHEPIILITIHIISSSANSNC